MVEKMGGEANTYTETTGNSGKYWIYKYDRAKLVTSSHKRMASNIMVLNVVILKVNMD